MSNAFTWLRRYHLFVAFINYFNIILIHFFFCYLCLWILFLCVILLNLQISLCFLYLIPHLLIAWNLQLSLPYMFVTLFHGCKLIIAIFIAIEVYKFKVNIWVDSPTLVRWTLVIKISSMLLAAIVFQTMMLCESGACWHNLSITYSIRTAPWFIWQFIVTLRLWTILINSFDFMDALDFCNIFVISNLFQLALRILRTRLLFSLDDWIRYLQIQLVIISLNGEYHRWPILLIINR